MKVSNRPNGTVPQIGEDGPTPPRTASTGSSPDEPPTISALSGGKHDEEGPSRQNGLVAHSVGKQPPKWIHHSLHTDKNSR